MESQVSVDSKQVLCNRAVIKKEWSALMGNEHAVPCWV